MGVQLPPSAYLKIEEKMREWLIPAKASGISSLVKEKMREWLIPVETSGISPLVKEKMREWLSW
jgi:hypothetical protein